MDKIELRGLRVLGTHGVLDAERDRAQPFEVDLIVSVDLSAAGASDALGDTVDYGALAGLAARVISTESHDLLERIAQRIATETLGFDERVVAVEVTVWKLRPPVPVDVDRAGVTIRRER